MQKTKHYRKNPHPGKAGKTSLVRVILAGRLVGPVLQNILAQPMKQKLLVSCEQAAGVIQALRSGGNPGNCLIRRPQAIRYIAEIN